MADRPSAPITLLLVDDSPGDRRLVQLMLKGARGIDLACAESMGAALEIIAAREPDAVLLDLLLPDSQGMDTVDAVREAAPTLPIVVLTGLDDEAAALQAIRHGCQDYLVKGRGDGDLIRRIVLYAIERKAAEEERRRSEEKLRRILLQTVNAVSLTLELRDPYTAGHQRRVARLASAIGGKMGLSGHVIEGLHTGALIHDIGKITVPSDILSRPGKLSEAAFCIIKEHPGSGREIVQGIEFPWPVATMILQHHERLDGSGYPSGLKGDDTILEARILAVADVVEAISSHRPYRPALGMTAALDEIKRHAGRLYDPAVVTACMNVIQDEPLSKEW
ncbi:MAG: response regulator [Alphaproteobacteria bacterium]|nr:response regulator [Alphaproteobacteria bacterium]